MGKTHLLDGAVLNELQSFGRSPQFLEQLIDIYENHAQRSMAELKLALQKNDRAVLRSVAHRFKGSSLNIGASGLVELLLKIESFPVSEALDPGIVQLLEELQGMFELTSNALKLLK